MNKYLFSLILFIFMFNISSILSEEQLQIGIEFDKKTGKSIDMNLSFVNSEGKIQKLKDIIKKPTVLSLVYYDCPGICSPLLSNLAKTITQAQVNLGQDYQVITISFDTTEKFDKASKWEKNYHKSLGRKFDNIDWEFFVGDSSNISNITDQVGFRYQSDGEKDFIHAGALIILSPEGKITRYLLGTEFNPFDFQLAIYESSKGISAPPISKLIAYCYSYDPKGQTYVFNFTKIAGTVIFLGAGLFLTVLLIKGRNKKNKLGENDD